MNISNTTNQNDDNSRAADLGGRYSDSRAVTAAMKATCFEALASEAEDPSPDVKELCPRAAHFERLARYWRRTAEIFDRVSEAPKPPESWMAPSGQR